MFIVYYLFIGVYMFIYVYMFILFIYSFICLLAGRAAGDAAAADQSLLCVFLLLLLFILFLMVSFFFLFFFIFLFHLDVCMSCLRRGHANCLCIFPSLTDDPRTESGECMTKKNCWMGLASGVRGLWPARRPTGARPSEACGSTVRRA